MSGELLLLVPGGDDDALAGVGGEASEEGGPLGLASVGDLGRGEVEISELLGSDHDSLARVRPWGYPV